MPAAGKELFSGSATAPWAPVAPARTKRAMEVWLSLSGQALPSSLQKKLPGTAPREVRLQVMAPAT